MPMRACNTRYSARCGCAADVDGLNAVEVIGTGMPARVTDSTIAAWGLAVLRMRACCGTGPSMVPAGFGDAQGRRVHRGGQPGAGRCGADGIVALSESSSALVLRSKRGASDGRWRAAASDVRRMKRLVRQNVATVSYRLNSSGMQEVRGSNPRSSTSQVRVIDSNTCREAVFLFWVTVPSSAASGESTNEQVKCRCDSSADHAPGPLALQASGLQMAITSMQRRSDYRTAMTAGSSQGSKTSATTRRGEWSRT